MILHGDGDEISLQPAFLKQNKIKQKNLSTWKKKKKTVLCRCQAIGITKSSLKIWATKDQKQVKGLGSTHPMDSKGQGTRKLPENQVPVIRAKCNGDVIIFYSVHLPPWNQNTPNQLHQIQQYTSLFRVVKWQCKEFLLAKPDSTWNF